MLNAAEKILKGVVVKSLLSFEAVIAAEAMVRSATLIYNAAEAMCDALKGDNQS